MKLQFFLSETTLKIAHQLTQDELLTIRGSTYEGIIQTLNDYFEPQAMQEISIERPIISLMYQTVEVYDENTWNNKSR